MKPIFNNAALISLSEIEDVDSKAFISKLVEEFEKSSLPLMSDIEIALSKNDLEKLEFSAHTLKSTSLMFGLEQLGEICREMESSATKKTIPTQSIDELKKIFSDGLSALKTYTKAL